MKKTVILCLFISICTIVSGCLYKKENSFSQNIFAMDTYMNIQATGAQSRKAVEDAALEIKRLDNLLSTGIETSEVSKINKNHGGKINEDLYYLIDEAVKINKETDGVFDITIYPVMKAWGFSDQNFRVPSEDELKNLLVNVDSTKIKYSKENNTISMPEEYEIDFGGIAKGYTANRIVSILKNCGIESAMINLGGNIQVVGSKPDGSDWKIGIEDPKKNGNYLGAIMAKDLAIVTSGGYERYFEDQGITYHHIIDPKTGKPAFNGLVSVTIVCDDGTLADALSTSLFIMGTDKAVDFWKHHSSEFDVVLYTDQNELLISEGLKTKFSSNYKYEIISAQNGE